MRILGSELCDGEENKKSRDAPLPDNGTGRGAGGRAEVSGAMSRDVPSVRLLLEGRKRLIMKGKKTPIVFGRYKTAFGIATEV